MFQRTIATTGSLWPRTELQYVSGAVSALAALSAMLEEFESALRLVPGPQAGVMRSRIRGASSSEDLWSLRTEVIELVSRVFDQWEARARIRDLDTLFERIRARGRSIAA